MPTPVRHLDHDVSPKDKNGGLVTLLAQTTKEFSASVSEVVSQQGYTLDEWLVLHAIQSQDGSSISQISNASGCYGATLTRVVDKLVANGLVYREASQVDRRKVVVFIADHGRLTHGSINDQMLQIEASVVDVLERAGLSSASFTDLLESLQNLPTPSRD